MDGVELAGSKIARFYVYWRAVAGDNPPNNPADPDDSSYDWNAQSLEDNVNCGSQSRPSTSCSPSAPRRTGPSAARPTAAGRATRRRRS